MGLIRVRIVGMVKALKRVEELGITEREAIVYKSLLTDSFPFFTNSVESIVNIPSG
jgi:hypothetical protein